MTSTPTPPEREEFVPVQTVYSSSGSSYMEGNEGAYQSIDCPPEVRDYKYYLEYYAQPFIPVVIFLLIFLLLIRRANRKNAEFMKKYDGALEVQKGILEEQQKTNALMREMIEQFKKTE